MIKLSYLGYGAGLLLGLLVVLNAYTTVEPGHNKVATLFGRVQPEP